ncbi:hypothetical protein RB213_001399 [Colletotrichum asianum]
MVVSLSSRAATRASATSW